MVKIAELKADVEALRSSQARKVGVNADPLLLGFLVENIGGVCRLLSFDGGSATALTGRVWGDSIPEGVFVLPPGFAQIISSLPKDAEIKIVEAKKGQVEIRHGRSKWKFPLSRECDSFIPLGDAITSGKTVSNCFSFDADFVRESLLSVYPSLGADYSGFCCLQMIFSPEKRELTTCATDTRRSTIWQAVNVDYPALPEPEYSLMLPGAKILAIAKFLKTNPGMIDICFTESVAVFESPANKSSIAVRLIDVRGYPPIRKLLELKVEAGYTVNPKLVIDAIKRSRVLLPNTTLMSRDSTLKIDFDSNSKCLTLSHESDLFTDEIVFKPLEIEGIETPTEYTVGLNRDFLAAALSLLGKETCEIKVNPQIVSISSATLCGKVIHFIATVTLSAELYKQKQKKEVEQNAG